MPNDHPSLDDQLRALRASQLDDALLDRLNDAAHGTLTSATPFEKLLEAKCRRVRPAPLHHRLLDALESTTIDLPAPDSQAIVAFPQPTTTSKRHHWRAAAAVAILGALCGLLIPNGTHNQDLVTQAPTSNESTPPTSPPSEFIPSGFSRQLSETSDEGIIWPSANPHRVVKVVYQDRVTMKRPDGSTYEVTQPRIEYYVVPTSSD